MAVVAERLEVQGVVILMVFVQLMDGELTVRFGDKAAPFASVLKMEPVPDKTIPRPVSSVYRHSCDR